MRIYDRRLNRRRKGGIDYQCSAEASDLYRSDHKSRMPCLVKKKIKGRLRRGTLIWSVLFWNVCREARTKKRGVCEMREREQSPRWVRQDRRA